MGYTENDAAWDPLRGHPRPDQGKECFKHAFNSLSPSLEPLQTHNVHYGKCEMAVFCGLFVFQTAVVPVHTRCRADVDGRSRQIAADAGVHDNSCPLEK